MIDLSELDSIFEDKSEVPSDIEFIYYIFFDKGITLKEFNELPIPYILKILKVHHYVKKEEEKAYKKARRK